MCGKNCGQKLRPSLRKIGLLLLLFLLVCSPSYSVEIEEKDFQILSNFVLTSETELPKLSSQLQTVNQKLNQSEQTLTDLQMKQKQLEISLENMEVEITQLTKSNQRWKIISSVGITVGVIGIASSLVLLFLK